MRPPYSALGASTIAATMELARTTPHGCFIEVTQRFGGSPAERSGRHYARKAA